MAKNIIDELHPIDHTPYYKSFPWLCFWTKCINKLREGSTTEKLNEQRFLFLPFVIKSNKSTLLCI